VSDAPKAHALLGGSTIERALNCPGSVRLGEKARATLGEVVSPYAQEGTALHTCAQRLLEDADLSPDSLAGTEVDGVRITADHVAECLQPLLDWFDTDLPAALKASGFGVKAFDFVTEQRVEFDGIEDAFGTADLTLFLDNGAGIIDFKFGEGVGVEAEGNQQLMFYAAAALDGNAVFQKHDKFFLGIYQPRRRDGEPFTYVVVSKRQLQDFKREVKKVRNLMDRKDAEFKTGEHCRFCPAAVLCPMLGQEAKNVVAGDVDALTLAALGENLTLARRLESWLHQLTETVRFRLEQGDDVPGWKLVEKRGHRKWVEEDSVIETALTMAGMDDDAMKVVKLVSPAQAEKALGKKKFGEVAHLCASVSEGLTIAPTDDPRPAQTLNSPKAQALAFMKHAR
jgi:hypothetical protein